MVLFTYDDYLNCKKILNFNFYLQENSSNYAITDNIENIHDKLYKDLLNDEEEFSFFLKHFIGYELPKDKLLKYNRTFITNDYRDRHADIIYKINNKPIYILVEHQSYIDHLISYRIFEYYSELLRSTINRKSASLKNYKIPIVIPIVLYTGLKPWKCIPNVQEKQAFSPFGYGRLNIKYNFINIHDYTTKELLKFNSYIAYAMCIDKCKNVEELYNVLNNLSKILTSKKRKYTMQRLIYYILNGKFDTDTTNDLLKKFSSKGGLNMKYWWDYIREDEEKIAKELIKKSKIEGKIEMVKNMIKNGETIEKIKKYSGISKIEIEKIMKEMNLVV